MKMAIFAIITTILLTSCGSDSAGGGSGIVSGTFTDSTVSSFTQTSNVAKNKIEHLGEIIIPSAYAASGAIKCATGATVDFSLIGLGGTNIDVTTECDNISNVDLKIRASLLGSLINKKMFREVTEQGKNTTVFTMPATAAGMATGISVVNNKGDTATWDFRNCYDLWQFNLTTGVVTITNDGTEGSGNNAACNTDKGSGANTDYSVGFSTEVRFRFIDGKVEFNVDNETTFEPGTIDGSGVPSNISYARWCIDDNSDGTCDI